MIPEKCQFSVIVGAQWGIKQGCYPLFKFEIYPDKLCLYSRLSLFGNRSSCTILKDNILEIQRVKIFLSGKCLKIRHNDFQYPTFVGISFGKSKDVVNTEKILNDLHYPIDLNSTRKRLKASEILRETTTYGDGAPLTGGNKETV